MLTDKNKAAFVLHAKVAFGLDVKKDQINEIYATLGSIVDDYGLPKSWIQPYNNDVSMMAMWTFMDGTTSVTYQYHVLYAEFGNTRAAAKTKKLKVRG